MVSGMPIILAGRRIGTQHRSMAVRKGKILCECGYVQDSSEPAGV